MKTKNENIRGFHWLNRSRYKEQIAGKEIMFGYYDAVGGTSGEMAMRWEIINCEETPQLQIFNDGFSALFSMPDLLEKLSDLNDKNFTDEEFVEILLDFGFKDLTNYGEIKL